MNTTVIAVIGVGVVILAVVMLKSSGPTGKATPQIVQQVAAKQTTTQTAITSGAAIAGALLNNWGDVFG